MSAPDDAEEKIEEAAAEWLAQREEGFSSAQAREFERWCRLDPRHAAAAMRLEAACALLEKMPRVRAELLPVVVEFPSARRPIAPVKKIPLLQLVVGLAAAVALAALGWWQWGRSAPAAPLYATSTGGYERVVLADGSVMELNANTVVRVDFAPPERRVALVSGEAHFTVAHDTVRPFIVSAGGVAVRAVGTAFNVRLASSAVEVLVTEGKVSVSEVERVDPNALSTGADPKPTRWGQRVPPPDTLLVANERALIATAPQKSVSPPTPVIEKIEPDALREALSWQERKLVFAETPLREVVAQFNRRNRLQLVLGDAVLAERPVGGTFAADNVEGFIRLLEGSGTIAVERRGDATVVLRTAR